MYRGFEKMIRGEVDLELDREYYQPGQHVNGVVSIKLGRNTQCEALEIHLIGFEHAEKGQGNESEYFSNSIISYDLGFPLAKFSQPVLKGTLYHFPFCLTLPANANSTFIYDEDCYALAVLQVSLKSQGSQLIEQKQFPLNILEIIPQENQKIQASKAFQNCIVCGLLSIGKTQLSLQINQKLARTGQFVAIKGQINNQECRVDVISYHITLELRRKMVLFNGQTCQEVQREYVLRNFITRVSTGAVCKLSLQACIPQWICEGSARGKISSRVYYINLIAKQGLILGDKKVSVPIIIQSKTPKMFPKPLKPKPKRDQHIYHFPKMNFSTDKNQNPDSKKDSQPNVENKPVFEPIFYQKQQFDVAFLYETAYEEIQQECKNKGDVTAQSDSNPTEIRGMSHII